MTEKERELLVTVAAALGVLVADSGAAKSSQMIGDALAKVIAEDAVRRFEAKT